MWLYYASIFIWPIVCFALYKTYTQANNFGQALAFRSLYYPLGQMEDYLKSIG